MEREKEKDKKDVRMRRKGEERENEIGECGKMEKYI